MSAIGWKLKMRNALVSVRFEFFIQENFWEKIFPFQMTLRLNRNLINQIINQKYFSNSFEPERVSIFP